ncbi:MAG: hypothetical protein HDT30_11845 [Clostridiales bacterium]|nr:hypothetical protein [Clostridiales bacterium]
MADKKEENKSTTYPSVEEKIKMQMEKEKTHYTKFENYLYKDKVLPNGLTVEEQQIEDIKNRSWEKKFSIRKDIFRKFDAWLDKKAQEAIEEAQKTDPFRQTGMGNGKADFWMGFTGQRQSRYSQDSLAGAFVRGSLNFLEGILEAPFMLEDPDVFMEELVNTPKAFGQMKEEIESGNQNIMGIMATEASWGVATAALGAAAKRNAAIERSNAQMSDEMAELVERMNECAPDGSCFLAGTLVATKTGKKAIEKIEEGEEVWCEEEDIGEQKLKKVLKRIEKTNDILYHVYIRNQEIHTTEDHAIWLEGEGWKKAEDVHVGDIVRCRTGEPEKITNIWMEKMPEQVKVYNLSVEECHNYYVSEKGVLVHNDCPRNNKVNIESGSTSTLKINELPLAKPGEDLYVGTYSKSSYWNKKTGLNKTHTPHHVVQDAVSSVSHGKGITINIRKDIHLDTKTYGSLRRGLTNRQHLAADIAELRVLLKERGYSRSSINAQLNELIKQNKVLGGFEK